ncbi:hypothetical protein PV703_25580 [Streptomyces sp. ME01-24h]|nr:hypothetical protein [Streptomyces sp. ME01-24h]
MNNRKTTHRDVGDHHGPRSPGPAFSPDAMECGIDGLAHLVDDLAHAMATTPEALLGGMSDEVLKALFLLHMKHEEPHGPRPPGPRGPNPGGTRA